MGACGVVECGRPFLPKAVAEAEMLESRGGRFSAAVEKALSRPRTESGMHLGWVGDIWLGETCLDLLENLVVSAFEGG